MVDLCVHVPDVSPKTPDEGLALGFSGGGYRAMMSHAGSLSRLNEAGLRDICRSLFRDDHDGRPVI
jgi:hypothetical protein